MSESGLTPVPVNPDVLAQQSAADRRQAAEQSLALAKRILGQAEVATALTGADGAPAAAELVAAREALECAPHLPSLAAALPAVDRALAACPPFAFQAVRAAKRAIQGCFSWHAQLQAAPRDQDSFIAAIREAFAGDVDEAIISELREAYCKGPALNTDDEAFRTHIQRAAERRGGPSLRHENDCDVPASSEQYTGASSPSYSATEPEPPLATVRCQQMSGELYADVLIRDCPHLRDVRRHLRALWGCSPGTNLSFLHEETPVMLYEESRAYANSPLSVVAGSHPSRRPLSLERENELDERGIWIGADGALLGDRNVVYIVDQRVERPSGPLITIDYFHGTNPKSGFAVFQYWCERELDDGGVEGEELDLTASQVISSRGWTVQALKKLQQKYRSRRFQRT